MSKEKGIRFSGSPENLEEFDGSNYIRDLDKVRLAGQMKSIFYLMRDCEWRTLNEIAWITGFGEASISAQLRNLRKAKFGGHIVIKRRRGYKEKGLWEYSLMVNVYRCDEN